MVLCFRPPEQAAKACAPYALPMPERTLFAPFREAPLPWMPAVPAAPMPPAAMGEGLEAAGMEIPETPLPMIEPPLVPLPMIEPPRTPVPGRAISSAGARMERAEPAVSEEAQAAWKAAAGLHAIALAEAEAAQRREVMQAERRLGEMIRNAQAVTAAKVG